MNLEPDEIREWLQKAHSDLLSAHILINHTPPVYDTACFHCQQAVEKVSKAFLVWRAVRFEKVHSLTYLLDLCEVEEGRFASLRTQAESLAPFAVEARYPGSFMIISGDEARRALTAAEAFWNLTLGLLPQEFHPQS